ncbi:hypothetical protein D3C71_157700 [compost metagenome]
MPMTNYNNAVYDDKARRDILTLRRAFPDKIFALAPYAIPTAPGFYKLRIAVLGADDFATDPTDAIFHGKHDATDWVRKIDGILGRDRATGEAIVADVARRAAMPEHGDEAVAAVYLTKGEIQTLIEGGVDAGYNASNPDENDPELEASMQKLSAALEELTGGYGMAR